MDPIAIDHLTACRDHHLGMARAFDHFVAALRRLEASPAEIAEKEAEADQHRDWAEAIEQTLKATPIP